MNNDQLKYTNTEIQLRENNNLAAIQQNSVQNQKWKLENRYTSKRFIKTLIAKFGEKYLSDYCTNVAPIRIKLPSYDHKSQNAH